MSFLVKIGFSRGCIVICLFFLIVVAGSLYVQYKKSNENNIIVTYDPVLELDFPKDIASILTIRDRLRALIGQWNISNIDSRYDDMLFSSAHELGSKASASCGPMAYALESVLQKNGVPSHLVCFYWVENNNFAGHTAVEASLDEKQWFLVDGHSGIVWQDKYGKFGSAVDVGCQALCYKQSFGSWKYYPSTHGKSHTYNSGIFKYALDYMSLKVNKYPDLISAIGIAQPTENKNSFRLSKLVIFKDESLTDEEEYFLKRKLEKDYNLDDIKVEILDPKTCGCN